MNRPHIYLVIIIAAGVLAVLILFGVGPNHEGQIVGTVTDALSGDPINGVRIIIGGRSTVRYLDKNFKISHLKPGIHHLKASAPGFETKTQEVNLRRGTNLIAIRLMGNEIPDLGGIIVFADAIKSSGIQLEIRFVNQQGIGIKHFPRLPLTMEARLYGQLGTKENYRRGRLIYSGPVKLFWDSEASLGKN
ncbi:MAG: carboxypeptidase regulatory-like domain-containing protein, partial [Desulfobacterales bacterium]